MSWYLGEKPFSSDQIDGHIGFVYEITDLENGKQYIGKKKFSSTRTLKPLKGQKRKRKLVSESDWMDYFGSNEEVKALVEEYGANRFCRKILRLCKTTAEMSYYETKEIFIRDALLESSAYYNSFVGCKLHRNHVKHLKSS
jgi:uncharacterized protein (DUF2147 family)